MNSKRHIQYAVAKPQFFKFLLHKKSKKELNYKASELRWKYKNASKYINNFTACNSFSFHIDYEIILSATAYPQVQRNKIFFLLYLKIYT